MEKLTEAGKLYLKDIYILEEARKDAFDYLNFIIDQVYEKWEEHKEEAKLFNKSDQLHWETWKTKGNQGKIEFYPKFNDTQGSEYFNEGDYGLILKYKDARHSQNLTDTLGVFVYIVFTNAFWKKLKQVPTDKIGRALSEAQKHGLDLNIDKKSPFSIQIQINPDETAGTIDDITEMLVEKCQAIEIFLLECL